jgi:hypothetical protein
MERYLLETSLRMAGRIMRAVGSTAVGSGADGSSLDFINEVLGLGRELVGSLERSIVCVGHGLASTVVPAGKLRLLVLGLPIPVFGYIGDDNQEVLQQVTEFLRRSLEGDLSNGHRLALHTFTCCLHVLDHRQILGWLPQVGRLAKRGEPAFLGAQLVTLYPFTEEEIRHWPQAPPSALACALCLEQMIGDVYSFMDQLLAERCRSASRQGERM